MAPNYKIYNNYQHQNNVDSIHSHCADNKTMNSSEVKKGTLVLIQNQNSSLFSSFSSSSSSSSSSLSTHSLSSPKSTNFHNLSKLDENRTLSTSGAKSPSCVKVSTTKSKRLPVIVSVYRKDSNYLALVTFAGRHQQLMRPSPLCVNLLKYKVYHRLNSSTIDLRTVGMEGGLTLTFEATSSNEASEWAKVFDVQNYLSDVDKNSRPTYSRLNNRLGGLGKLRNNLLSNSLEEIEEEENTESLSQNRLDEEINEVFIETTDNGHIQSRLNPIADVQNKYSTTCLSMSNVDNIQRNSHEKLVKVCDNSNSTNMASSSSSSSSSMTSSFSLVTASLPSSSPYWNSDQSPVSCVSRRPSLPVLSESEEEEEEEDEE